MIRVSFEEVKARRESGFEQDKSTRISSQEYMAVRAWHKRNYKRKQRYALRRCERDRDGSLFPVDRYGYNRVQGYPCPCLSVVGTFGEAVPWSFSGDQLTLKVRYMKLISMNSKFDRHLDF